MLIAFIALIAMLDSTIHGLGWCLSQVAGNDFGSDWSLSNREKLVTQHSGV